MNLIDGLYSVRSCKLVCSKQVPKMKTSCQVMMTLTPHHYIYHGNGQMGQGASTASTCRQSPGGRVREHGERS
jgi:hypothetical protein